MTTDQKEGSDEDALISRKKAAEMLDVHPTTVVRMAREKRVIREVFIGGRSRYSLSDVLGIVKRGDGRGQINVASAEE